MVRQMLTSLCVMALCSGVICSCTDEDVPVGPDAVVDADLLNTVSEHLHFQHATKLQGNAPTGSATHSLKISFKDTLYLTDTISRVVKFQHLNPAENITGVYLQVFIGGSGGIINADHYYDVQEQEGTANSDSVSVFLIGLKENDLPLPARCRIRMAPHKNGQVIGEAIKDIVIEEPRKVTDAINNGGCGLVLPPEQSWYWEATFSFVRAGALDDYYPDTILKGLGIEVQGCCVDGKSDSGPTCLTADPDTKRTLLFPVSYQIASETFKFFDNGTFARSTLENTANPAPDLSNFCGSGPGIVKDFVGLKAYTGNWSVIDAPVFVNNTQRLTFANITSTGTGAGFGNRGGYIHQLECREGWPPVLVIIDPNPEGNPLNYTLKAYIALDDDRVFARWHAF